MTKKRVVSRSTRVDADKVGDRKAAGTGKVYRGTVEAQWSCNSCGNTGIPGSVKRCPNCGNPKDASEEYEAPASPGDYLSAAQLRGMGVDPKQHLSDETCGYCGAKLKPGTQKCPNCGAPLDDVGYTTRACPACGRQSNEELCPNCGAPTEPKVVAHHHTAERPARKPAPKTEPSSFLEKLLAWLKNPKHLIPTLIVAMLLCFISCVCIFTSIPRNEAATVAATSWERTIAIEEHQYNRHEGWDPPSGADIDSREERIHHHDQVLDGYEEECGYEERCETRSVYDHTETTCYDDGTCDEHDVYREERECHDEYVCEDVPVYRDVPVYKTWYTYHVWEWVEVEPAVARGNDPAQMRWPDPNLTRDQREGQRTEHCEVAFRNDKGDTFTYTPPCAELERYPQGSRWKIRVRRNRVIQLEPAG